MSLYNYTPQSYVVLENASDADNFGECKLASDFKTRILDLISQGGLDGDLVVYESDRYEAPDVTQPVTPDNYYFAVPVTDMSTLITYFPTAPFNPGGGTGGRFNVETTGSRWIIPCILNRASGTVDKLTLTLYDNQ